MIFEDTDPAHAVLIGRAVVDACRGSGWSTPTQPKMLRALFRILFSTDLDVGALAPLSCAAVLATEPEERTRREIILLMLLTELMAPEDAPTLHPVIERWAEELGVEGEELRITREILIEHHRAARVDLHRARFGTPGATPGQINAVIEEHDLDALVICVEATPQVADRYHQLEHLEAGTLGRGLWEFYRSRGWRFPGEVGGVREDFGRHDWIHVLCEYDTTLLGESEQLLFRATSTSEERMGFHLLSGLLIAQGALIPGLVTGTFEEGHAFDEPGAIERAADALHRGRACTFDFYGAFDPFDYADHAVEDLLTEWSIPPKAAVSNQ